MGGVACLVKREDIVVGPCDAEVSILDAAVGH